MTALLLHGLANNIQYEERIVKVTVGYNETFWDIAKRYYDPVQENRNFNEYMYDVRKDNGFEVGGGRRHVTPGEIITIVTHQRK